MASFFQSLAKPGAPPIKPEPLKITRVKVTTTTTKKQTSKTHLSVPRSVPSRSSSSTNRHAAGTSTPASHSSTPRSGTPSSLNSSSTTAAKRKASSPATSIATTTTTHDESPPKRKKVAKPLVNKVIRQKLESSDEEDSGDDADSVGRSERSTSLGVAVDRKRNLLDVRSLRCERAAKFIHAKEIADVKIDGYRRAFPLTKSTQQEVSLYYPALATPETYCITINRDPDNFQPVNDIVCTIELIAKNFLPDDKCELVLVDGPEGILHKIKRAWKKSEPQEFFAAVERFNKFIQPLRRDGVLEKVLKRTTNLNFELIEHILGQSYARTVALDVDELRKYEAFSNNVYGELLPRFTSQVFRDANLRSDSVFVDLGSGIGNVVLHAALEIGCESWGCEVMPKAADLAEKQAKEFRSRCKLWGIRPGKVELRKGDFLEVPDIPSALRRADLLLVNNYAFAPELNARLLDMFLELKDGAQIVSLKSFVPLDHQITERNADSPMNLLTVKEKEYFSGCVSWTNAPGRYYVSTVDRTKIQEWYNNHLGGGSGRSSRRAK